MKINITNVPTNIPEYTNICPENGDDISLGTIEQASCTDILAMEIIDYSPLQRVYPLLASWTSKLRHGGQITITGTDYIEIARAIMYGKLNSGDVNKRLYGEQRQTWEFKTGCYTLSDITDSLRQLGLKIIKQRLNGFNFEVMATRP
jgi:hypothetical protein